ncbi:MAG: FtsH protease activity modulator HflK [Lachnospiraceae bacterium]|nr:FtsH protease activity modulator HflK [Lachnospiraceae bacterium]
MGKEHNDDDVIETGFVIVEPAEEEKEASAETEAPPEEEAVKNVKDTDKETDAKAAKKAAGQEKESAGTSSGTSRSETAGKQRRASRTPKKGKNMTNKPPKMPIGTGGKAVKSAGKAVIAAAFLVLAATAVQQSVYSVGETESVVITTFGKASVVEEKGLHFKIPFIQHATRVDTTVKGLKIGYSESSDGTAVTIQHESIMITSDYNFIDCDFYVSYQVTDPVKYLYQSDEPDLIVKNIAMSSIRSTLSAYTVDTAITTGKAEIQSNVRAMIVAELEEKDIGITLIDASIQDVEPPTDEIIEAFTAVETAKQGKESSINQANAYRNEQIPAAEAEADRIKQEAEAKKTARINEAKGQAARFEEEYAEYVNYPLITKQRMFMETMEDVLPTLKVVIDNGEGSINKYYPITDLGTISAEEAAAVSDGAEG